mmetsp:Transcript_18340/g.31626  ORF Transcript_18340/g.31626 Transcript_18340/m.31626 type:complete len:81 (-) Transcript_18340:362-604(-)
MEQAQGCPNTEGRKVIPAAREKHVRQGKDAQADRTAKGRVVPIPSQECVLQSPVLHKLRGLKRSSGYDMKHVPREEIDGK